MTGAILSHSGSKCWRKWEVCYTYLFVRNFSLKI